MELVKYEAACRAIAEIKTIDEVKETCSRSEAFRAYARQAKNKQLELDAMEIRVRAERKGGEILIELKEGNILRPQGVRDHTDRGRQQIRLSDLGLDGDESGLFQRLAKLSTDRFEEEVRNWRIKSETSSRLQMPLNHIRKPSMESDNARASHKKGRFRISVDPLDQYRSIDGRRIADWRAGELDRIDQLAIRMHEAVVELKRAFPIANPEPLDTMEMIYKDRNRLIEVLSPIWDLPVVKSFTGVYERHVTKRTCAHCGVLFKPTSGLHRNNPNSGKFCSRRCSSIQNAADRKCGT
jgi:hypothetical protein